MSQTPSIDIIAGADGFKHHAASTVTGVEYDALVVREDTVFSSFTVTPSYQTGANVLSDRGMSGVTFKQGEFLPAGKGKKITGFVIASGSVIGY